jgi:hypothetical protein
MRARVYFQNGMTYKYSQIHTVTTTLLNLGVPLIPGIFANDVFTIILRNTGGADAVLSLIGATGDLLSQTVPGTNNGIVLSDMEWTTIANGIQGQSTGASTTVHITIVTQAKPNVNVITTPQTPIVAALEQAKLEAAALLESDRDYYTVVV